MNKWLAGVTLGTTGLVTAGLIGLQVPASSAAQDAVYQRDEDLPDVVMTVDDDDDDDTFAKRDGSGSKDSNTRSKNSNSPRQDRPRGRKSRARARPCCSPKTTARCGATSKSSCGARATKS